MPPAPAQEMQEIASATCPFCGLPFSAGYVAGEPAVLHGLPTCEKFNELQIDEFLAAVNAARRN